MKDFFDHLQHNHKNAIKAIKDMIDVDGEEKQKYSAYKEAATLCNFIFTYPHRYSLIYHAEKYGSCLLYTSPSPRDRQKSRMPSSA